jgi:hypothetical protein
MASRKGYQKPVISAYEIELLSPDRALIAYPLVLAGHPEVELEQWLRYVRALTEQPPERSGVLGLRGDAGYFCGLLIYRNDREPWHEPRLSVELFVAVDLVNVRAVTDALLAAAEAKAAALACAVLQIRIEHGPDLVKRIRQAGYRPAAELMTKDIPALPKPN